MAAPFVEKPKEGWSKMGTPRSKPQTDKVPNTSGGVSSIAPKRAPMMASGVGKAAPVAPKRTPMMGSGVGKAAAAMKKGGMAKMTKSEAPSKMGKVKTSSNPDGVATKGKTKGTMVKMKKMAYGGKC